jgi:hypothetical protein
MSKIHFLIDEAAGVTWRLGKLPLGGQYNIQTTVSIHAWGL